LHRTEDSDGTSYQVSHPNLIQDMGMNMWAWTSAMESRGMTTLMPIADTALNRPGAAWVAQTEGKKIFSSTICCRRCDMYIQLDAHHGRFNTQHEQKLAYFLKLECSQEPTLSRPEFCFQAGLHRTADSNRLP